MNDNNYCLILAGGKGRRLWPCSRESYPKQFLDFFSTGKTLLQSTFDRMTRRIPAERVFVSTNQVYEHIVKEQLPQLPPGNILAEPVSRDTAPSTAWATFRIVSESPEACIVVVPSDQTVFKEERFLDSVCTGLDIVSRNDWLLALGVRPTRPEPGYGYIQTGAETAMPGVFRVKSFTEKPDREFAKMFVNSGEFFWNTGMFLGSARCLRESLRRLFPSIMRKEDGWHKVDTAADRAYVNDTFCRFPRISLDYGILEKCDNVHVMVCDFGWADLGTWHSIYEGISKGEGDNVIIGSNAMLDDSHNNIIKLPADHLAIVNGLDGYIVAEKGNVLLICKKGDSSALIRKYINEVQIKYGDDFV